MRGWELSADPTSEMQMKADRKSAANDEVVRAGFRKSDWSLVCLCKGINLLPTRSIDGDIGKSVIVKRIVNTVLPAVAS